MTRKFTFTILAMLFAILGPGAEAWGQTYEFVMELDMTTKAAKCGLYNTTTPYGDWKITNGANNNGGWAYFKMGGKSATISTYNPCYIYYSANSGVSSKVDKITVSIADGSLSKSGMSVNSWGVYVYSDKAMTTQIDYVAGGTITKNAATFDFTPSAGKTWAAGSYYKVSWDLANTSSTNGIVCVDKITLYKESTPSHTLTFSATNGSITALGEDEAEIESSDNVEEGATLDITATADDWYKFSGWSVTGTGSTLGSTTTNPTTFTMGTADATLTASFETCSVTVSSNDETMGSATYDATTHIISTNIAQNHRISSAEPYTIVPANAATLTSGDDGTFVVSGVKDQDVEITINFEALPSVAYTVFFDGNDHGTPASESITEASAGAGITLPGCTPNTGYQFVGWATTNTATEADAGVAGETYNPTENITLYAVYNQVYTITWSVNGTPTTEGNPTTSVVEGEGITTLPTAPASISGMAFQGWTATQIESSSATAPTDLFTDAEHAPAITANTTFYAVFAEESEGDVTWNNVTTLAGITEGQYVIINGGFYLPNTKSTSSGPAAVIAPAISENTIADENVIAAMKWSFTSTGTTNQFYVKNSNGDYLYATANNNGLRISNTEDKWTFAVNTTSYFSMKESNNNRYCAKYSDGNDWRSYGSATHSNYANGGKLELYKKTQDITYTYYTNVVVKQLTSISLSGEYPTEFWKGEAFSHDGMMVTAHYENADDEDVTSKAEFSTPDMSTVGVKTVTVSYETASKTYDITVKTIANNAETAYTVEEAKAIIDANPAELTTESVYVKGTVSKIVTAYSSDFGNITFDVSADGQTTGDQFQFYRNFKDAGNTHWASAAECPAVGDDVIGYGMMQKHNSTYEFGAGNYLVSHIRVATLSIGDITVELGGTIAPVIETNVPEAERSIEYTVPSENVVKVNEDGKLVTVAVGGPVEVTATLTAEGYKSAETTFKVTVIKALEFIAVKEHPTTLEYKEGDKFNPAGLVITANYNDESTEDVAYAENEDKFTFTPSLETPLTTEDEFVTITYAGKETTQDISVRALYTYDITWKANGEQFATTQVTEGNALVLPETNPANVGDMAFQGWINTENYYDAETAPEYIVPSEIIPTGAMTFYAVYAKAGEGEPEETEFSFNTDNFTEITTSYTTTFTHTFPEATVEAYGVYKNGGIQMNSEKDTYIKNTTAMPGYMSKIVLTWKASGKNSVTMYANANSVASTSSDNLGKQSTTTTTHTINIDDAETKDYKYFYLDGTTVTGACVLTNFSIFYMKSTTIYSNFCTTVKLINEDKTISGNPTWEGNYTINGHTVTIGSEAVLTVNGALINTDPKKLIIEDGGQLIHHNAGVAATVKKNITGYTYAQGNDGYYLIANPTNNATVANLTNNNYDLYTFNPAGDGNGKEWINMKNLSMDVENGIGYLYANDTKTTLEFAGNLTPAGSSNIELTYANAGEGFDFPGFNLIGNPFACNAYPTDGNGNFMPFYKTNETGSELTLVKNVEAIAPCEGFFVEAEEDGQTVVITTEESEVESSALSLTVSQNRGSVIDRAIVSFNGSANLHKFMLNPSHTNLSIAKDGETFAAVSSETKGELPVSFKAETTGTYTISVNTENVTAGYIHLIDNMTGTDVDLLATPSYTFIGSPRDNENRFTVKFEVSYGQDGDGDEHFAYQNGSELVVNGEGTLQIFDVLGRVVVSEEVHGQTVNVGGLNTGAYIVRLTGESVKTQKIVVR